MDTKALRQKILDLAIRGKLVPQDPADEPAAVLLERIRAEKQQMVKDGKLKAKDIKNDTVIYVGEDNLHYEKFSDGTVKCIEDEIPFEIPDGWAWTRLRSLLNLFITGPFGSSLHKSDYVSSGTPLINPMNIVNGRIQANPRMLVSQDTVSRLSVFKVLEGDIVIARRGEMGRCAVVDSSQNGWLCGTGSFDLRVSHLIDSNYIAARIRASDSVTFLSGNSLGNTMLNLNQSILNSLLIPVPPFNEQRRVLCAISEANGLLSTLAESNTKVRTFIVDAKAKILDLAIRGKLVPQDPADEPASVLLERIRADKEEQIKAGKIKRDKKESFIFRGEDNSYYEKIGDEVHCIDDEIPFPIPQRWQWCRLKECCLREIKRGKAPKYAEEGQVLVFAQKCNQKNGMINLGLAQLLDPTTISKYPEEEFTKDGDVIINSTGTGTLGRVGLYKDSDNPFGLPVVPDSHITTVRCHPLLNSGYIYTCIKSYQHELEEMGEGSTNQKELRPQSVQDLMIPIPPANEQSKICTSIDSFIAFLETIEQSLI